MINQLNQHYSCAAERKDNPLISAYAHLNYDFTTQGEVPWSKIEAQIRTVRDRILRNENG